MSDTTTRVRFFGSLCASIVGYECVRPANGHDTTRAHAPACVVAASSSSSSTLKMSAVVRAATPHCTEAFAAVSTSSSMPLPSALQHTPVAAAAAAAATTQQPAEGRAYGVFACTQRSLFVPLLLVQQQQQQQQQHVSSGGSDDAEDDELAVTVQLTLLHTHTHKGSAATTAVTMVAQERVPITALHARVHDDVCAFVALPVTAAALHKHSDRHDEQEGDDNNDSAAARARDDNVVVLRVLVALRVFDLSAKARAAIEAVELLQQQHDDASVACVTGATTTTTTMQGGARLVRPHALHQWPIPSSSSSPQQQSQQSRVSAAAATIATAPYGCMPLSDLYRHYRLLHAWWCDKRIRHSDEVIHILLHNGSSSGNRRCSSCSGCSSSSSTTTTTAATNDVVDYTASERASVVLPQTLPLHSWHSVTCVSLHRVLLGDDAAAPLLLTLAHCTHLQELHADHNALGDATCARLCALFGSRVHHHHLHTLSLTHNRVYELGATHLLWLVRRNACVTRLHLEHNPCSSRIRRRIDDVCAQHARVWRDEDVYNVTSTRYAYLHNNNNKSSSEDEDEEEKKRAVTRDGAVTAAPIVTVHDRHTEDDDDTNGATTTRHGSDAAVCALPLPLIHRALTLWSLLTPLPVGDADVWPHNSTTTLLDAYVDDTIAARRAAGEAAAACVRPSLIPPVARAPLLNEVARTAARAVAAVVASPLVCSVFADVLDASSHTRAQLQRVAHDTLLRKLVKHHRHVADDDKDNDDDDDDDDDNNDAAAAQLWREMAAEEDEQRYAVSFVRMTVLMMRALACVYAARCPADDIDNNNHDSDGGNKRHNHTDDNDISSNKRQHIALTRWQATAAMLRGIGRQHAACGVGVREYAVALRAWVTAVQTCCGADIATDDSVAALLVVLVLMTMRVLRLKVHEYVHVLDNNTCEVLTLLGPLCYTLREHHTLVHTTPQPCVVVPPGCYVVVQNPVTRTGPEVSDGATATAAPATTTMRAPSVTGTEHGSEGRTTTATTAAATAAIAYELITTQSSLLRRPTRAVAHVGGCEYRFTQPPFALFPGEWATRPQRLCLLAADEALVLRVKAAFVDRVVSAHGNSNNSSDSDSDGDSDNTKDVAMTVVHRREGDEYLFCGPGLYYPHVRESVTRRVRALRLRRGEAVHVCARRAHVDVVTGDKRVAGEEWQEDARVSTRRCARDAASSSSAAAASSWPHIHTPRAAHGLYFVAPDCRVVRVLQPHAVTRSTALCVCARTSHYDARAQRHRAAGTRWLVTYEDTTKGSSNNNNNNNNGSSEHAAADDVMTMPGQYTPRYTEDVVGTVALTVLCARQYALITRGSAHTNATTTTTAAAAAADNDAHTQPSPPVQRRVGPCAFFLQPGECLVGGTAHDALVLERDEAVLVEATTAAARIQSSLPTTSATVATATAATRTDGDADDTAVSVRSRWLVRGPRVYIPDVGVRVCERRRVLPLHPLEGVYVRNTRTGQVRSVVGQPLLLDADEQLWHKPLSPFVRRLLRSPGLTRRASAPRALPRDTTRSRGNNNNNNNNNNKNMKKKKSGNDDDDEVDEADDSDAAEWVPPHTVLPGDDDDDSSNSSSSSSSEDDDDACDDGDNNNKKHTTPTEASARRRRRRHRSAAVVLAKIEPHTLARVVDVGAGVSRVVHGPAAVLLAPHEELAVLSLSGGTPKRPAQIASLRLFLGPDYAADDVDVQTRDHARWRLRVAYSWSFDAQTVAQQPAVALAARDCLRVACRALASRIRARVARAPFAHFHRHAAAIVHDAVFGSNNNSDIDNSDEEDERARCGGDVPHDTTTTTQASNNNNDDKRTETHDHSSSRRSRSSRNRSSRCSVSDAVTRRDSDGALCFVAMALRVTNVEVQSVEAVDAQTRLALMRSVQLAVEIITRTQESEATHRAMTREQQAAGARERQVVLDKAAAEEVRVALLRVVAHNTAVEQTGASRAQALAEAHAREREAHAELDATPLRCGVHEATADAEHAMLRRHAALDVAHRSAMNALAVDKARALADVAARKYEAIMAALGTDTLLALAQAGPALQARLLAALGLQGYLVLDGTAPVHLLHTATQLTNTSSSSSSSSTLTSPHATNNKDKAPPA